MEAGRWSSGQGSALGLPCPTACVYRPIRCMHTGFRDTQDALEARRPHLCIHTFTPHRFSLPHASAHSSIHSSDFKGWPVRWVPGTQWGTSSVEPWLQGAHSPGGAQLPLINSQDSVCDRGKLCMQQQVGWWTLGRLPRGSSTWAWICRSWRG